MPEKKSLWRYPVDMIQFSPYTCGDGSELGKKELQV
jgi:hypothetical protein